MSLWTSMVNKFSGSKTEESVGVDRVEAHIQTLYALVEQLTPNLISLTLNQYLRGDLKAFSILWRDIRTRDDRLPSLEDKRTKSVARLPYELVPVGEETPAYVKQKEAIEYFFNNMQYTDCMNREALGGMSALLRGMMLSLGYGWSVQEIVWRPSAKGLTATFVQIPLECFRKEGGSLTYLETEYAVKGVPLDPNEWLVSAYTNPLGVASMILYYYKRMPLKDWLIYCKRYVIPALHGKTSALKDSPEWNSLKTALGQVGQDWALITGRDVDLLPVDKSSAGELPYAALVDRCDRCLATIWRGADLSTMSSKNGVGASLQESELNVLDEDDAGFIGDIVNIKLLPQIIRNVFGEGVEAEVKFQLSLPKRNTSEDMKIDTFFIENGIPVSVSDLRKRYGRTAPDKGDEIVDNAVMPKPFIDSKLPTPNRKGMPNAQRGITTQYLRERSQLYKALANDLAPLRGHLEGMLELQDDEFVEALNSFAEKAPDLYNMMDDTNEYEEALINAAVEAYHQGLQQVDRIEGVEA